MAFEVTQSAKLGLFLAFLFRNFALARLSSAREEVVLTGGRKNVEALPFRVGHGQDHELP
jgi:hypothetical protein